MKYDTAGNLELNIDENHRHYIPKRHVFIIYSNILSGKTPMFVLPGYEISREIIGFILANPPYKKDQR